MPSEPEKFKALEDDGGIRLNGMPVFQVGEEYELKGLIFKIIYINPTKKSMTLHLDRRAFDDPRPPGTLK